MPSIAQEIMHLPEAELLELFSGFSDEDCEELFYD